MGMALGWISIALAGLVGAPKPERANNNAELQYTVRFIETEGLNWRQTLFSDLKPVARQGAAMIWTAPRFAAGRLSDEVASQRHGRIVRAPRVTMKSGQPAHVSMRSNRRLITQVSWNGEDEPEPGAPEVVRTGPIVTMAGRKLDQGVLVQLVCEDTQVSAVHHILLGKTDNGTWRKTEPITRNNEKCDAAAEPCALAAERRDKEKTSNRHENASTVAVDVPEITHQEIAGEWLIPNDGVLLVSFGPNTTTDDQGKAVVRERLAVIEATAEADGAVPMEFTAVPANDAPTAPIVMPRPAPEAPKAANAPVTVNEPAVAPAPVPDLPSRTIPRGVNPDGTPAPLPPLPASETVPPPSTSAQGNPVPTPQSKQLKPVKPNAAGKSKAADKPNAADKPHDAPADPETKPTSFHPPARTPAPARTDGRVQTLTLKPVSLRLPFNQRLELKVLGRIVPGPGRGAQANKGD